MSNKQEHNEHPSGQLPDAEGAVDKKDQGNSSVRSGSQTLQRKKRPDISAPMQFEYVKHDGHAPPIRPEDLPDAGPHLSHQGSASNDIHDSKHNEINLPVIPYLEGLDQKKEKGRGSYGAVYEVKLDGLPCIAKGLHDIFVDNQVADTDRHAVRKKFFDECLLLNKLKHPNIVQFLGVYHKNDDVYLVMEYMHMALDVCLKEYPNIPLPFKSSIVQDVSYGLLHLHSLNPPIIHRDLTASNILLTEGMKAKIADLGVSKMFDIQWLQQQSGQTVQPGTPAYMPPEALTQTPSYDFKLDIFSFGVLMLYTATQEFPAVYELSEDEITKKARKNHTMQILKRKCWIDQMGEEHPFRSIVIQCLQDRPEARPTTKILSENMSSIYCKNKKEWKNILELHCQLQTSSRDNEKLQHSIIELQKSNAELEQTRSEAESVRKQLEKECQQHKINEEQLYTKLVNQTSEFRDKQRQMKERLNAAIHPSKELKLLPILELHSEAERVKNQLEKEHQQDKCDESHNTIPASKPRQCPSTISGCKTVFSASKQDQSQSIHPEMDRSVDNIVSTEEQDSSSNFTQRQLSRDLGDPSRPPPSETQDGDTSFLNADSVIKIPEHECEQSLSPISKEPSSIIKNNHSHSQRKPSGGVAVMLPLNLMEQEQKIDKCNDNHDTKSAPVPKRRQRAFTISEPGPFLTTQQNLSHSIETEIAQSVENHLGHSSLPQSTEGLGGNTSLPNPDSFVKIPQLICEQSSSPISREPSSSFLNNNTLPQTKDTGSDQENKQIDTCNDNHDKMPAPKPRQHAFKSTEHGPQQDQSQNALPPSANSSSRPPLLVKPKPRPASQPTS